jgi:chromosome partitioning protein
MHVLVMASQKGGAGKTTLAFHLAVAAEGAGAGPAVLVDTDTQGTLTKWWETREADTPRMAKAEVTELKSLLRSLEAAGFHLAIIDTAGRSSEANRAVIEAADFVLMPVKPSAADLWALGATVDVCKSLHRPFAFAVCQATRNAAMTVQAVAALASHGPVAPIVIHNRVNYAAAMGSGLTLQEIEPKGPGADEIAGLWAFVQARLPAIEQTGNRARKPKETVHA